MTSRFQKIRFILSWKIQIVFIFTGILVGLLVTAQFRSALPASSYPYDEIHTQQELIQSYNNDQSVLKSKILNLRQQIGAKQQQSGEIVEKNNLEVLHGLKKEIGLDGAKGPGVTLVLDDGVLVDHNTVEGIQESFIQAADLRDLVNLLFSANAEAIAVNDQRIIASTPITSVGNTILVNNFHMLPPFTITAIGDADIMLPRLNDQSSLPDLVKRIHEQKVQLKVSAQKNLVVPIYNGNFLLKYLEEVVP